MKHQISIILLLIGSLHSAACVSFSLLYSPEEQKKLERHNITESHVINNAFPDTLELQAIVYTNQEKWTVWINGHKFTRQEKEHDFFKITSLSRSKVSGIWRHKSEEHLVELSPHKAVTWNKATALTLQAQGMKRTEDG